VETTISAPAAVVCARRKSPSSGTCSLIATTPQPPAGKLLCVDQQHDRHTTRTGGEDFASGVVNVRDTTPSLTTFGLGFYLEGNVILDAEQLVRNYDPAQTTVTFNSNVLPYAWNGPAQIMSSRTRPEACPSGIRNLLHYLGAGPVLWDWFSLQPGSPARGSGRWTRPGRRHSYRRFHRRRTARHQQSNHRHSHRRGRALRHGIPRQAGQRLGLHIL